VLLVAPSGSGGDDNSAAAAADTTAALPPPPLLLPPTYCLNSTWCAHIGSEGTAQAVTNPQRMCVKIDHRWVTHLERVKPNGLGVQPRHARLRAALPLLVAAGRGERLRSGTEEKQTT
jgi:hypothetical protein